MKTASTVARLPIVGVNEGEQIATVKDFLVNRKTKKVEFITVQPGGAIFPSSLAYKDIVGVGNDYIVTKSADYLKKTYDNRNLIAQMEECLLLDGRTVLSSAGDVLGEIADFAFDEKSGDIVSLTLTNGQEVDGKKLVTLAQQFVMTSEEGAPVQAATPAAPAPEPEPEVAAEPESKLDEGSLAYLDGKKVTEDVTSDDGEFTVKKGTVLNKAMIEEADKHNALLALTMVVE
ncbi:PRC-barrel domain-containing protein [Eubacteriales bacterium OttesenSCG-928-N14]|nr:PRC-barrel domain-containing protein [Eubacteriales bacterium OttesenSCG-928-N14]